MRGTLDLALELATRAGFRGTVVASDFALPMLLAGKRKILGARTVPLCGDALALPFEDDSFAGATVGFGVRNLSDLEAGLRELNRVLLPGARLVILEFTLPPNPLVRRLYLLYFKHVLPRLGRRLSGHPWAYTYLPESVGAFPGPDELERTMKSTGFVGTGHRLLSLGIVALHWGVKPLPQARRSPRS